MNMNPRVPQEAPSLKPGWKTIAIGRHLVDVPGDAKLRQSWRYNKDSLEPLPVRSEAEFKRSVDERESFLKMQPQRKHARRFIERLPMSQDSVLLISWADTDMEMSYIFDAYFRAAGKAIKYSGEVSIDRKQPVIEGYNRLSQEWRAIPNGEIPTGIGFVAGDMLLAANRFNPESWELSIQLVGRPDVSFRVTGFAVGKPDAGLRERAGGVLTSMLGAAAGLQQLRNRSRPVGPIDADEILVAARQDGKRHYGFKWEAPGKAGSLAEPNLNATLRVGESAYETNAQSFANDQEALDVWDAVVESIRLRPGAAG